MKCLIIKDPWISVILQGQKVYEIRGSRTNIRGEIGLIKSGSGQIFGTCELIDCIELDIKDYQSTINKHCIKQIDTLPYKRTFAWILKNPKTFVNPIKYKHPNGAIIWVNVKKEST